MENISQLVDDSLARHGVQPAFDHLRLHWSRWLRCESSFSVLLAPAKPGIFALGEEIISAVSVEHGSPGYGTREEQGLAPCAKGQASSKASAPEVQPSPVGKRMLALFQISESDDLGMTLGRLFLPGNPLRERLASGRCFTRYTVIEDAAQRTAACAIFQRWIEQSAEVASGIGSCGADIPVRELAPSASFAWTVEVQNRETPAVRVRPAPLPAGF